MLNSADACRPTGALLARRVDGLFSPKGWKGQTLSDFLDMRRDDEWLPRQVPPPHRGRVGWFVRRAVTVVVCFALGVGLAGGVLLWRNRNELVGTRIAISNLGVSPESSEGESEPEGGLGEAKTVLVVGDDSGDKVRKDLRHVATGDRSGHRTDTIMLLRIDPQKKRVTGVNFPRDLRVPLCDGSVQKINAAFFVGGPNCLVETIREFSGVRIDHFVQVDFEGFVDIVNAVNGVTMFLEEPMSDPKAHLDLPAGCVTLDGVNALGFVRTRADSDFGRIARQQRFIKELADEATSLDVVANPVRLFQTVEAVGDMLTVDDEMTIGTMRDFALTLRGIKSDDIVMETIPTVTDNSTGLWYEIPIADQTQELLRAFKRGELAEYLGEVPEEGPSEAASDTPRKPKIPLDELSPIAVLNASDVSQLAADTASMLSEAGVQVATTGDAEVPEPGNVRITYPGNLKPEARALKVAAFPDAVLERDPKAGRVTVVLNGDFDPDLMEVAGAEASEPEEPQVPENEYANAEPVKRDKNC
jgi:LCP family protein required for cell wall assembly